MVADDSASIIALQVQLHHFTTIGQEELNKLIIASKPTTCLLVLPEKLGRINTVTQNCLNSTWN